MPALIKANRIQEKVSGVGFDWEYKEQVWDKVTEELNELKTEISRFDEQKMEEEFGDLIFSMINAARLYGIDPETALGRSNRKFHRRFRHVESSIKKQGREMKDASLSEMDAHWEDAKKREPNL